MTQDNQKLQGFYKTIAKFLAISFLIFIGLLVVSWNLFKSNHKFIRQKIKTIAIEKYNVNLDIDGYQLEFAKPFPTISFQIEDLSLSNIDFPQQPAIKINQASSKFDPWDLVTKNFMAQPLTVDSIWLFLYKDSLSNNSLFSNREVKSLEENEYSKTFDYNFKKLPLININYLDFHHQNASEHKWQRAKLTNVQIKPLKKNEEDWYANLSSNIFFEGLVFNKDDGGFLRNKFGQIDLNISLNSQEDAIILENSELKVDETIFLLNGKYVRDNTNHLQLKIANEGVTMNKVIPMLSDKIEYVLKGLSIDQPIAAQFSLNKYLKSGIKEVVDVSFQTEDARMIFKDLEMSSTNLSGNFSNDCDNHGIGNPMTTCLNIDQLSGEILDVLPIDMRGRIYQLTDPRVDAVGSMNISLPRLNDLLATKDNLTFINGDAKIEFTYQGLLNDLLDPTSYKKDIMLKGDAQFNNITLKTDYQIAPSLWLDGHLTFDENQALIDVISLEWMGSKLNIGGKIGNLPEFIFYDAEVLQIGVNMHLDHVVLDNILYLPYEEVGKQKSNSMNIEKLKRITQIVEKNIEGKIDLEIDRLVYDTFYVDNLKTQFQIFSPSGTELLGTSAIRTDSLSGNFMGHSPFRLALEMSENFNKDSELKLEVPKVSRLYNLLANKETEITEGDASFNLTANLPLASIFKSNNILAEVKYYGDLSFDKIEMEVNGFDLPVKKVNGHLNFDRDQIIFDNLKFQYEGSPFKLTGKVDNHPIFHKRMDDKTNIDIELEGDFLDVRKEKRKAFEDEKRKWQKENTTPSLSSDEFAKSLESISPPDLFRSLDTLYQLVTGKIDLSLDSILTDSYTINPFLLQARLSPDASNLKQHQLLIDDFLVGFGKSNTIKGTAKILNPESPVLNADLNIQMNLNKVGKFLTSDFVEMRDGYFNMDLDYKTPLYDSLNLENYFLRAKVNGESEIINGKIFYNYREFNFENINSNFSFNQQAIFIKGLDFEVNENRFLGMGQSNDFFPFFILPDRKVSIKMEVASPYFDFGKFTSPQGLGKDTLLAKLENEDKLMLDHLYSPMDTTGNVLTRTKSFIDQLLDDGSIEMTTTCDKLVYNDFVADNLEGEISLKLDSVKLKNLVMDVAEGAFQIDGILSNVAVHEPVMEANIQMVDNDVREIFRQFDNFGQSQLGYQNLNGNASASIAFKTNINSSYSILPETMRADIDLKLSGGQLLNLGALKKVSGFLFRNRGMDNILIDTLETSMYIRENDMYIENFLLHSTSFDFGVEGIYSLGANNNTRILFTVPVSNLYRKHLTRKQLRSGNAKRKGIKILIEAREKKNKLRFRWKLFKGKKYKYRLPEKLK